MSKKLFVIMLLSVVAFTCGARKPEVELPVKWNLKYGILTETGGYRGERPDGYMSDVIVRQDETELLLKNFYCFRWIDQTVCPVVFFDKNGKVISYQAFAKQDGPKDYAVKIPANCYKYQLSTEEINKYKPVVLCDRDGARIAREKAAAEAATKKVVDLSLASMKSKIKARKVTYSMPVDTSYTFTVETDGESLSSIISKCEKRFKKSKIRIIVNKAIDFTETDVISGNQNSYVITSTVPFSTLKACQSTALSNGILRIRRPSMDGDVSSVYVGGVKYDWTCRFDEEEPYTLPTFNSSAISLIGGNAGTGYSYKMSVGRNHGIEKGAVVKLYTEWISVYAVVTAVTKQDVTIRTTDKLSEFIVDKTYPVSLYNVFNMKSSLKPGQFWYDSQYIYCKLLPGAKKTDIAQVGVNSTMLRLKNASNIVFKDIEFYGSCAADMCLYREQAMIDLDGTIAVEGSRNIHFVGCEFTDIADNCISIRYGSEKCSVQGCYFHDIGTGGVAVNNSKMPWQKGYKKDDTKNILIYSNVIRGYGKFSPSGAGIVVGYGDDVSVISNHVFDGYYTGISVGWGWSQYHMNRNNYVAGNVVHHIMKFLMCDGGGIYTLSCWDGGSIECNEVYCVNTRSRKDCCVGIYHDQGSSEILDYGNLVYACDIGNGACERDGWIIGNTYSYIGTNAVWDTSVEGDKLKSYSAENKVVSKLPTRASVIPAKDYSGKVIPPFRSRYADKTQLSKEYQDHYKSLYNRMSLNKNNEYFK